jgi:hypothetical protein
MTDAGGARRKRRGAAAASGAAEIEPEAFERYEGFRETTLAVFTESRLNAALRVVGDELYTMGLEYQRHWPGEPEGSLRHLARAGLADLRHLQGFFAHLGREWQASELKPEDERLSRALAPIAEQVREIADLLERKLGRRTEG